MEEDKKIKPLTKSQILVSLDRLTRFKPTEQKYLRVFREIILSNLISPRYKKSSLDEMDYATLEALVSEIFELSLNTLECSSKDDYSINKALLANEKSLFKFDEKVEKLLTNRIDYKSALSLFSKEELPKNLKEIPLKINKILIVEGLTEEILLPNLAKLAGFDFEKNGIYIISAGGKNQVVKLFYTYAEILKIPIFVLMDYDANDNYEEIKPKLRAGDEVYLLKSGEFEDILPFTLIKRALNKYPQFYQPVTISELRTGEKMTIVLDNIFKSRGLEFKKADFAHVLKSTIKSINDVSEEIIQIINQIGA